MRHRSRTIAMFIAAIVAVHAEGQDSSFSKLSEEYLKSFPHYSPVSATLLGDHRFDARVDDISQRSRRREAAFLNDYLKRLAAIKVTQLSRAEQIDAQLLRDELKSRLFQLETIREWEWNPLYYTALTGDAIYGLMARDFAPTRDRLVNATLRLQQFPKLLAQVRETLVPTLTPKVHAETAVKQNRGVLSVIENTILPVMDQLTPSEKSELREAVDLAREAIDEHQEWLETELVPNAEGDFRIGKRKFEAKLRAVVNTEWTADEVLSRARRELVKTRAKMYEIACSEYLEIYPYTKLPDQPSAAVQQSIIRAVLELAYDDQPDRHRIVETARETLMRCEEFVREKDLVTVPTDPVEIIVMPEFRRGVSLAYCDSPGALDSGQKTFYAVSPLPADWNEKQTNSFLREYNMRSLTNLTVHEAMPGHFLQLAHSNRYPSTLRAVLSSGTFVEGWAVYTEQMMAEEGFLGDDQLMKLIVMKWYLRGIANAIMDQEIHVHGMTRDQAMRLMIEDTFQEEREAAAKWIRAQLTSSQLSTYFIGVQEHWAMRRAAEAQWGDQFQLKKYHDLVISFGSPPVRYVRGLVLEQKP